MALFSRVNFLLDGVDVTTSDGLPRNVFVVLFVPGETWRWFYRGELMTDAEILACAREAFDAVAKEVAGTMGAPSNSDRATVCKRLVPALREGASDARVVSLSAGQRRRVVVDVGKRLVRALIERTFAN